jgi:hypothetical protein
MPGSAGGWLAVTGIGALPIMEEVTREAAHNGQRAGFTNLDDMEPIDVVAYIESHKGSAATMKQQWHDPDEFFLADRKRHSCSLFLLRAIRMANIFSLITPE